MAEMASFVASAFVVGTVATALMDLAGIARERFLGATPVDYRLLGRWTAGLAQGRFFHAAIAATPAVRGERLIGWLAHYATGIAFAAMLLAACGTGWVHDPTPAPALIVGFGSIAAPFFVMQPGMGLGIAARRSPRPAAARLRTLATHAIFSVGLYAGGWAASLLG